MSNLTATGLRGKANRGISAYVPEGFDPAALGFPSNQSDYAALVVWAVVRFLRSANSDGSEWVPLYSDYVRAITSRDAAKPVVDRLTDAGVLEPRDAGSYRVGTPDRPGVCKHFRLGAAWRERPTVRFPVTTHKVVRKLAAHRASEVAEAAGVWPVVPALVALLDRFLVAGEPDEFDFALDAIDNRQSWAKVDRQGLRFHTPLTCVARRNRRLVRLDGERVWSTDIVSSQPLIAHLQTRVPGETGGGGGHGAGPLFVGGFRFCQSDDINNNSWQREVESGGFYDRVAERGGLDRDAAKRAFMLMAFGEPRLANSAGVKAIKSSYPEYYRRVTERKARVGGGPAFACELQRVESRVMIGVAAADFARRNPSSPFGTVHDSFICRERDVPAAERSIKAAWRQTFGVEPSLKTGLW